MKGFVMISPGDMWREASAGKITSCYLISMMKNYVDMGLTLYVGTDSMLYSDHCTYSCIVAVHANHFNIARYFYQKQKFREAKYKNLETKILKEVELSIQTASFLKEKIPEAKIEIHVDIGDKERNATRHLVDSAQGWITSMGFEPKIKPDSWASSVADWHTK